MFHLFNVALLYGFLAGSCALLIVSGVRALARYLTAKRLGLAIRHFALGFGPTFAERVFTLAGVPVQLRIPVPFLRVEPEGLAAPVPNEPQYSIRSRALPVLAGIASTALLAWVAFFLSALLNGDTVPTNRVSVEPSGPAAAAGLRDGDAIVAIDGRSVDGRESINEVLDSLNEPSVRVAVVRGEHREEYLVTPRSGRNRRWELGVVYQFDTKPMGVMTAVGRGFTAPIAVLKGMLGAPRPLVTPSPATARHASTWAFTVPILVLLWVMGRFATLLTFVSLVPLPGLDGARMLVLAAEAIRRRPVSIAVDRMASNAGLGCLAWGLLSLLVAFATVWSK